MKVGDKVVVKPPAGTAWKERRGEVYEIVEMSARLTKHTGVTWWVLKPEGHDSVTTLPESVLEPYKPYVPTLFEECLEVQHDR